MDRSLSFNSLTNSSIALWLLLGPRHPSIHRPFPTGKSVASLRILSSISGIMQNALGCGWISIFPLSLLSAAGVLPSQFWPLLHQRLQTPPWLLPLSCPCGCQWLCPVLEAGDSSSLVLFTPNPAIWKWQWLFISFPKLPRVSLSHPHLLVSFLPIVFHSFLSSLVDVILAFISRVLQTHLPVCVKWQSHHSRSCSAY